VFNVWATESQNTNEEGVFISAAALDKMKEDEMTGKTANSNDPTPSTVSSPSVETTALGLQAASVPSSPRPVEIVVSASPTPSAVVPPDLSASPSSVVIRTAKWTVEDPVQFAKLALDKDKSARMQSGNQHKPASDISTEKGGNVVPPVCG
jgi:hypothetical protein